VEALGLAKVFVVDSESISLFQSSSPCPGKGAASPAKSLKSEKSLLGTLSLPQLKILEMRPQKGFTGVKSQIPPAQGSFYTPVLGVRCSRNSSCLSPAEGEAAEHFL